MPNITVYCTQSPTNGSNHIIIDYTFFISFRFFSPPNRPPLTAVAFQFATVSPSTQFHEKHFFSLFSINITILPPLVCRRRRQHSVDMAPMPTQPCKIKQSLPVEEFVVRHRRIFGAAIRCRCQSNESIRKLERSDYSVGWTRRRWHGRIKTFVAKAKAVDGFFSSLSETQFQLHLASETCNFHNLFLHCSVDLKFKKLHRQSRNVWRKERKWI